MNTLRSRTRGSKFHPPSDEQRIEDVGDFFANIVKLLFSLVLPYSLLFVTAAYGIYKLAYALPSIDPSDGFLNLSVKGLSDAQRLARSLQKHSNESHVFALFSSLYLFKQAFSLPGALALNLVAGALYGTRAFPLCTLLTAIGASFCYLISFLLIRPVIEPVLTEKPWKIFEKPQKIILEFRKNLSNSSPLKSFNYLVAARIFPFTPNWFLNISSPICRIKPWLFFVSTLVGLAPYNYLTTQAGLLLIEIESLESLVKPQLFLRLCAISFVATLPILVNKISNKSTS